VGLPAWTDVEVISHRGLVTGYPENTVAAFRHAITAGITSIELDLRGTADGEVVVLHDETVDRTTDRRGEVAEMTFAEVRACDAGSHAGSEFTGEPIPSYQEVLECVSGTGTTLVLDIKGGRTLDNERVVRLTERYGAVSDVVVGVRSVPELREFRRLNPRLRMLGLLPGSADTQPDSSTIKEFARVGADIIRLWPSWIFADRDSNQEAVSRSSLVACVHEHDKPVWSTADTLYDDINPEKPDEDLRELIKLGVNGIITNLPQLLADILAEKV
jgi:glycerophosphoryl diester phosphodiesterase